MQQFKVQSTMAVYVGISGKIQMNVLSYNELLNFIASCEA
jgi:hypothetical protein